MKPLLPTPQFLKTTCPALRALCHFLRFSMRRFLLGSTLLALILGIHAARPVFAAADEPKMDYPTFKCLGVMWTLEDKAQKAKVAVEYKKDGTDKLLPAQDLFRVESKALPKTHTPAGGLTLFAGSIVGLDEDTAYKIKLTLTGAGDKVEKVLDGKTRKAPRPEEGDRQLHVIPGDGGGTGTKDDPFKGLKEAQSKAQPGDVFLLHKGVYQGTFVIERMGNREHPITYRGAGDGEAIIDGGGASGPSMAPIASSLSASRT